MKTGLNRFARLMGRPAETGIAAVLSIWALANAGVAHAETTVSAEASLRAQVASNPYLASGEDTAAASATVSFTPALLSGDGVTEFRLTGRVVHTEFSRRYRGSTTYGGTAAVSHKFSSNFEMKSQGSFDSQVVGAEDILVATPNGLGPDGLSPGGLSGIGVPPFVPGDTSLDGLQRRRSFLTGDVDFRYRANSRDMIDFGASFGVIKYIGSALAQDSNIIGYRLGYGRKLSDRMTVGFTASGSHVDYRQRTLGDARTYSGQVTLTTQFDARWSLTASVGPSFASIRGPLGRIKQTTAGGSLNLCNGDKIARTCVFLSRAYQPSSLGGIRPLTNWGTSYSRRLTPRSDILASASFGKAEQVTIGGTRSNGYGRADLSYNRRLTEKLKGYISGGYSDSFRDVVGRKPNAQLSMGITYMFGNRR